MSFVGWIIEVVYRSSKEKRFVNPGFLSGPFVPIYGFGAVIITGISVEFSSLAAPIDWTITLLSPTILEYFGGRLMQKCFGMKLWDYSKRRFNLNGYICLRFSLYWAILAALLTLVIQPAVYTRITILGPYLSHFFAGALCAYLVVDMRHSISAVFNFKAFQKHIAQLIESREQYKPAFGFDGTGVKLKLPAEIKRVMKQLSAFPALRDDFNAKIFVFPDKLRKYFEDRYGE
jgi:uncharacterized membrane protein